MCDAAGYDDGGEEPRVMKLLFSLGQVLFYTFLVSFSFHEHFQLFQYTMDEGFVSRRTRGLREAITLFHLLAMVSVPFFPFGLLSLPYVLKPPLQHCPSYSYHNRLLVWVSYR